MRVAFRQADTNFKAYSSTIHASERNIRSRSASCVRSIDGERDPLSCAVMVQESIGEMKVKGVDGSSSSGLLFERSEPAPPVAPGAPQPLGQRCPSVSLHSERVNAEAMVGLQPAWAGLAERALEPNVFLEPAFALPLLQHSGTARRPDFLLVWQEGAATSFDRLVGLLPLMLPRHASPWPLLVRGFNHALISLGTPLLDRDFGIEAFETMLGWLAAHRPTISALCLSGIVRDGAFHTAAARLGVPAQRAICHLDAHERAVLRRPLAPVERSTVSCFVSARRRKELGRQRRRLSEAGVRTYTSARTPSDVARAAERFLALEHNGWKGRRGTALLANQALATFTRTMSRLMAHEGKCRIDAIELDSRPVAMGIVITVGDRAHFWKTSFDETYATLSPGVQFALEFTAVQAADPTIALTDSCAVPDHPMIDRVWPDRMGIADLMIDLHPDAPSRFAWACRLERLRRTLRAKAKAAWRQVRRDGGRH